MATNRWEANWMCAQRAIHTYLPLNQQTWLSKGKVPKERREEKRKTEMENSLAIKQCRRHCQQSRSKIPTPKPTQDDWWKMVENFQKLTRKKVSRRYTSEKTCKRGNVAGKNVNVVLFEKMAGKNWKQHKLRVCVCARKICVLNFRIWKFLVVYYAATTTTVVVVDHLPEGKHTSKDLKK